MIKLSQYRVKAIHFWVTEKTGKFSDLMFAYQPFKSVESCSGKRMQFSLNF
jgi:hypothetical protein